MMNGDNRTMLDSEALDAQITTAFGKAATNKGRYGRFSAARPGIPRHVMEGMIDGMVPGAGPITQEQALDVHRALASYLPDREKVGEYRYGLVEKGEALKLVVHVWAATDLRQVVTGDRTRAVISLLNTDTARIPHHLIDQYPALLSQGMWGLATLRWQEEDLDIEVPGDIRKGRVWIQDFQGLETGTASLEAYVARRSEFGRHQWRHLLCRTLGYNPAAYSDEQQLLLVARLVPIIEPLIAWLEMAAKGIGKSYVYQNFGTRVLVVAGGKVSPAVLFYNNRTGELGLLGRYDTVVLDEIQSATFDSPTEIVAILKTYLASGEYNRGGKQTVGSDCSLVMVGNAPLDEDQQLRRREDLLSTLPHFFMDTAFLDRIFGILPSWGMPKITDEAVRATVGLKLDYFARIVHALRTDTRYYAWAEEHTAFPKGLPQRDRVAVLRIASGMLKLLYPDLSALSSPQLFEEDCLGIAVRMRGLVQEQLRLRDAEYRTYPTVDAWTSGE